ncbi:hypothetical protein V5O48_001242 [Marasmius crinis-equi]|uniref:Chromo domain-containing protein n=1 Tax=Marasmius crinis-equi TaxID=585013 RepID=A0ABR3FYY3_9AGAR
MPPNAPPQQNLHRAQQPVPQHRTQLQSYLYGPPHLQHLPPGYHARPQPQPIGIPQQHPGHPGATRVYNAPPPIPQYSGNSPRNEPLSLEQLTGVIMSAIGPILTQHQTLIVTKHDSLETSLQSQINSLAQAIQKLQESADEVKQVLKNYNDVHQRGTQRVANRIMDLEKIVGGKQTTQSYGNNASVLERLDSIAFAVEELLERAQDPQANTEPIIRHDAATDPIPQVPQVPRHERATSPILQAASEPKAHDDNLLLGTIPTPATTTQQPQTSRSASCSLDDTDDSGRTLCTLSPADWTKNVRRTSNSVPPFPFPLSKEPAQVELTPSPILIDEDAQVNDDNGDLSADHPSPDGLPPPSPNPNLRAFSTFIEPDNDLLKFEPDNASTPAPPQQVSQSTSTTATHFRAPSPTLDHVPSSRTPSPMVSPHHVAQSRETVDRDDEEVERMITAPTSSMMTIASPAGPSKKRPQVPGPVSANDNDDDDALSDLTDLTSSTEEKQDVPKKRRRLNPKEEMMSSPARRSLRQAESAPTSSMSQTSKPKKKRGVGRPRKKIVWPEKVDSSCRNMIECDRCRCWFHYGCVGLTSDEIVLLNDQKEFLCPACVVGKKRTLHHTMATCLLDADMSSSVKPIGSPEAPHCARPDCGDVPPDEFFVERLIGRKTESVNGGPNGGPLYTWLIRWLGYGVWNATWENEQSFGDQGLIDAFYQDIAQEGVEDDGEICVLLQEAIKGGWDPEKPTNRPFGPDPEAEAEQRKQKDVSPEV